MPRVSDLKAWVFATWDRLQPGPVGSVTGAIRRILNPIAYGLWAATTWLATRHPRTFTEKLRYRMLHDRRPLLTIISDKLAVRAYVADRVGDAHLSHIYQVRDRSTSIGWGDLPREFVCKVTHASGGTLVVTEHADPKRRLPAVPPRGHWRVAIHPDALERERAERLVQFWLDKPYGWSGFKREWAYRNITPRVMIEEYLGDAYGGVPADYKFYMFDGRCAFVHVDTNRYGVLERDLFTATWQHLAVSKTRPSAGRDVQRPPRLDEMLEVARRLSIGLDFVRVDLYGLEERVVFGELTLYPASGRGGFDPPSFDRFIGDMWRLPPLCVLEARGEG